MEKMNYQMTFQNYNGNENLEASKIDIDQYVSDTEIPSYKLTQIIIAVIRR